MQVDESAYGDCKSTTPKKTKKTSTSMTPKSDSSKSAKKQSKLNKDTNKENLLKEEQKKQKEKREKKISAALRKKIGEQQMEVAPLVAQAVKFEAEYDLSKYTKQIRVLTDEEIGDLRAIVREARDKVVCLFLPS
jgi:hypothetical protein